MKSSGIVVHCAVIKSSSISCLVLFLFLMSSFMSSEIVGSLKRSVSSGSSLTTREFAEVHFCLAGRMLGATMTREVLPIAKTLSTTLTFERFCVQFHVSVELVTFRECFGTIRTGKPASMVGRRWRTSTGGKLRTITEGGRRCKYRVGYRERLRAARPWRSRVDHAHRRSRGWR